MGIFVKCITTPKNCNNRLKIPISCWKECVLHPQPCFSNNLSKWSKSASKNEKTAVVMEVFSDSRVKNKHGGCQDSQPRLGRWSQAQQPAFHRRRREWCCLPAECLCTGPWECWQHGPAAVTHTKQSHTHTHFSPELRLFMNHLHPPWWAAE